MHAYQFYVSPEKIIKDSILLEDDEFVHCCRVLRKQVGDSIRLIDGRGYLYKAVIRKIADHHCECAVQSRKLIESPLGLQITLGVGLVKQPALGLLVRQAVSLGMRTFIPLKTENAVKQGFNRERYRKIAIESLKQSGGVFLPEIREPLNLVNWYSLMVNSHIRLIAHPGGREMSSVMTSSGAGVSVALMIGPEGGFTERELQEAYQQDFIPVKLHPHRLRTELAVTVSLAQVLALSDRKEVSGA